MTTVSTWATSARGERRRYPENADDMNEDLQAIDAIEDFLTGGQSTLRAARCVAGIYEPRLKTLQRRYVAILWAIICQAARSIDGSAAERLAGLLIALRDQADVISCYGWVVEYGNCVYWRDLPKFGQMFREYGFGKSREALHWLVGATIVYMLMSVQRSTLQMAMIQNGMPKLHNYSTSRSSPRN
jgi:hypothetical protein